MLVYILKSTACLAILYVFYNAFLEKESIHRLKRFYLLGALLFSLIVPALVLTEYVEAEPVKQISYPTEQAVQQPEDIINVPTAFETDVLDIAPLLWSIYFIGLFLFSIKFLRNLIQIFFRIRKNPKHKLARITQVLLKEKITPHTFMSYIFLNKSKFERNQIPKEVLLHEETHAKQKHSLDVLFVELLQVIFWVNPLIYLSKKAIKLNHEFLADQSVLENNIDQTSYKNTLLSYLSPDSEKKYQPLSNAINYSSIKKRFKIMKKQTSKTGIVLRSTVLIPLLAILLFGFSETKIIVKKEKSNSSIQTMDLEITPEIKIYNSLAKKYNAIPIEKRVIPLEDLNVLESIYRNMSTVQKEEAQPFPECLPKEKQEGATKKQIVAYNKLAKKYNTMIAKSGNIRILKADIEQLTSIYGIMTEKQKASAQPFPEFPEPPQPPKAPKTLKGEKSDIPTPPNAPKTPNTSDDADNKIKRIIETLDPYNKNILTRIDLNEQPIEIIEVIEVPSALEPPTPPSPLDYVINAAKKGASFMYEGENVSSDKAIDLLKNKIELNIESRNKNGKQIVRITKDPVTIE